MDKSADQSVPIGGDWETSRSLVNERTQQMMVGNRISNTQNLGFVPPAPTINHQGQMLPSNNKIVRVEIIGTRMKLGFVILFLVWSFQLLNELHYLNVLKAEGDPDVLESEYKECNSDYTLYDFEDCLDAIQEDIESYQFQRIVMVVLQMIAWALVALDLIAIANKLNRMQISS